MHDSISIENISFSRYFDIKTTKCLYFGKNLLLKIELRSLEMEYSKLTSRIAIFQYEWGSHIHFRSSHLADTPLVPRVNL